MKKLHNRIIRKTLFLIPALGLSSCSTVVEIVGLPFLMADHILRNPGDVLDSIAGSPELVSTAGATYIASQGDTDLATQILNAAQTANSSPSYSGGSQSTQSYTSPVVKEIQLDSTYTVKSRVDGKTFSWNTGDERYGGPRTKANAIAERDRYDKNRRAQTAQYERQKEHERQEAARIQRERMLEAARRKKELEEARRRCFASGTLILMGNGEYKAIETIQVGDEVMSFDEMSPLSSILEPKPVLKTYLNEDKLVVTRFGLTFTPNHPIPNEHGEYVRLGESKYGLGASSERLELGECKSAGKSTVHNFTVKDNHTYVVKGLQNLRVHNVGNQAGKDL